MSGIACIMVHLSAVGVALSWPIAASRQRAYALCALDRTREQNITPALLRQSNAYATPPRCAAAHADACAQVRERLSLWAEQKRGRLRSGWDSCCGAEQSANDRRGHGLPRAGEEYGDARYVQRSLERASYRIVVYGARVELSFRVARLLSVARAGHRQQCVRRGWPAPHHPHPALRGAQLVVVHRLDGAVRDRGVHRRLDPRD